jgi:hypothetical protein
VVAPQGKTRGCNRRRRPIVVGIVSTDVFDHCDPESQIQVFQQPHHSIENSALGGVGQLVEKHLSIINAAS